jgi:hypothetical protein
MPQEEIHEGRMKAGRWMKDVPSVGPEITCTCGLGPCRIHHSESGGPAGTGEECPRDGLFPSPAISDPGSKFKYHATTAFDDKEPTTGLSPPRIHTDKTIPPTKPGEMVSVRREDLGFAIIQMDNYFPKIMKKCPWYSLLRAALEKKP